MAYFSNFPLVDYKFGNEESTNVFTNIAAYVEVIDQIKDNISFYNFYTIIDGDRPDTLSYKLYNSPAFYWTFFFLNDSLKEQGWPLTNQQLDLRVRKDFPNTVLTTKSNLTGIFLPGQTVTGLTSGVQGVILKRRLDFGQIVIEGSKNFINGEIITSGAGPSIQSTQITTSVEQYNAIHHYENDSGEWVDIDPYSDPSALLLPITNYDRYVRSNDELKTIKILKPAAINNVSRVYKEALAT